MSDHSSTTPLSLNPRLFPVGLVIAGVWAFHNSLGGAMVFDDHASIVNDLFVRRFGPWSDLLNGHRPFLRLTFALNHYFSGLEPTGYHIVNLAIHLLAGLALYGVIRRTVAGAEGLARYAPHAALLAFCSALLWLVHPLQTGSVTYIVQRGESMMGMFYLACLYFFIRGAAAAGTAWLWYACAIVSFTVGIASKEVIATAPVVILLYDRIFLTSSWKETLRRRWVVYLIMFSPGLLWMILNMLPALVPASLSPIAQAGLRATAGFNTPDITPFEYAATQPGVILHYLRLVFWPTPLVLDYHWLVLDTVFDVVIPSVIIGLLFALSVFLLIRRTAVGFVAFCFFIILAPTSSIMPILDPIFEHRMYLSLACVVILGVFGLYMLLQKIAPSPHLLRIQTAVVLIAALALSLRTIDRNEDYHSPIALWEQNVSIYPDKQRAQLNLGVAYARGGQRQKAMDHYLIASQLESDDPLTQYNLGFALQEENRDVEARMMYNQVFKAEVHRSVIAKTNNQLGLLALKADNLPAARRYFQAAVRAFPVMVAAHSNLALVDLRQRNYEEALARLDQAIEVDASFPDAHFQRGVALEGLDRPEAAMESYARALTLRPNYVEARQRFDRLTSQQTNAEARALIRSGKHQEALAAFNRAVEQDPTNPTVYNNLGNTYLMLDQPDKAIEYYRASLRILPDQPEPLANLAWVLAVSADETLRNPEEALKLAEQACLLADRPGPNLLDTRAAAYAANGQYNRAINDMRRAIRQAETQELKEQLEAYRARIALYRRKQPYIMP